MPTTPIHVVLERHVDALMQQPGVVGVAQGECDGKPCIKILVRAATPELRAALPEALDGYAVELMETGEIKALCPDAKKPG